MSNNSLTRPFAFKRPSSSARHDFIDGVLNVGGSEEGDGGGISNDSLTHPFVFKRPSSSAGHDFIDEVLNVGGSDEG
jgi:hypothetical protein